MLRYLSYKSRFIISYIVLVWLPIIHMGGIAFYVMQAHTDSPIIDEYNQLRVHTEEHLLDTFFIPVKMLSGVEEVFSVQTDKSTGSLVLGEIENMRSVGLGLCEN